MADAETGTGLSGDYNLYWGDIHNHNAIGYAKGSLERTIDIAQEHLDFFAFTGHASWHDMPEMPGDRHMIWVNGFKVHSDHWPKTRELIRNANSDSFVAFLGYEWHSSEYGDYCLVFPEDQPELYLPDNPKDLFEFAKRTGAIALTHHVAYKQGWRGANWEYFDPEVMPVVEVYSEHGCTMSDRSPYPMILHSNGGRSTSNTIEYQLKRGLRFGFTAGTDDHFGYPGAYREGVTGVWAKQLTPEAIFDAIRNRRTYGATGDRIAVEFTMNDAPMGSQLPSSTKRHAEVAVKGEDPIHMVELVKNGRVIRRHFPEDDAPESTAVPARSKIRLQYGWGPWAAVDLTRVCDWDMRLRIENGRFEQVQGYFQAGPYEEDRRDRLQRVSDRELHLRSFTSRREAFLEDPTKSLVCEVVADPDARLVVELSEPSSLERKIPLQQLTSENDVTFTGVFTSESFIVHRLARPEEYAVRVSWDDDAPDNGDGDWYYVRVRQHNGELAWSSPIWIG